MRKYFGMSWAGWANLLVLQWMFVRLGYCEMDRGNVYILFLGVLPLTEWGWGRTPQNITFRKAIVLYSKKD